MDDRRFDKEPDLELEDLLADSLSAPPPDDLLTEITPWRQAMNRILDRKSTRLNSSHP